MPPLKCFFISLSWVFHVSVFGTKLCVRSPGFIAPSSVSPTAWAVSVSDGGMDGAGMDQCMGDEPAFWGDSTVSTDNWYSINHIPMPRRSVTFCGTVSGDREYLFAHRGQNAVSAPLLNLYSESQFSFQTAASHWPHRVPYPGLAAAFPAEK